jgi:mycothiol synthase
MMPGCNCLKRRSTSVALSSLPEPFAFRPASPQDAEAVMAVFTAAEKADNGVVDTALDDILSDWARPSFDLETHTVVVTDGQAVVAYADEFNQRAFANVHPAARGRGIGAALLAWTEECARADGAQHVGQTLSENETAARALLTANGYTPRWDTWVFQLALTDDLPAPTAPAPGLTLRSLRRPDEDRAVYELIDTAFDDWPDRDPGESFEDWRAANLDRPDTDPGILFVVDDGEHLVGAAVCMRFEDEGWIHQLAVERRHRGKGLGSWLLAAAFAEFRSRGLRTAGLSTDSRTGARDLYERVGMRVIRSYARFSKPLD